MKETPNTAKEHKEIPAGTFNMRIGGTTYLIPALLSIIQTCQNRNLSLRCHCDMR